METVIIGLSIAAGFFLVAVGYICYAFNQINDYEGTSDKDKRAN